MITMDCHLPSRHPRGLLDAAAQLASLAAIAPAAAAASSPACAAAAATNCPDSAASMPVQRGAAMNASAMDTSGGESDEKQQAVSGRTLPHGERKRQREHVQERCSADGCHRQLTSKDHHHIDGLRVCGACYTAYHKQLAQSAPISSSSAAAAAASSAAVSAARTPLHAPLSKERRWAIVAYDKLGLTVEASALQVGCSTKTVRHWINFYRAHQSVDGEPHTGRPANALPAAVAEAKSHPFAATPRMLKAKLQLEVSKRTIRRRLNDDMLFGRVSRHFFKLTDDVLRKRLSFGNGYKDWSEVRWMSVLFADEKIFTLGNHGQVWVQRPPGAAWQRQYVREEQSHPPGVNFWGCFSSRGVGGCETFSYNNNGSVMAGIVKYHLINSAKKLFKQQPPEQWWLLWDNSPTHKAIEVRNALHGLGVSCLELSPYSPDLNPMENLLNDMARRVEQRYPSTIEELEDAIHAEWPLTNVNFLNSLARSMPHRIKAVLDNQGHATKY